MTDEFDRAQTCGLDVEAACCVTALFPNPVLHRRDIRWTHRLEHTVVGKHWRIHAMQDSYQRAPENGRW